VVVLDLLANQVYQALKDFQDFLDHQAYQVRRDLLVCQEWMACLEHQGNVEIKEILDPQVYLVRKVHHPQASRAVKEIEVHLDLRACKV